eukprot:1195904-Prorocentrum_minimum.AAC.7
MIEIQMKSGYTRDFFLGISSYVEFATLRKTRSGILSVLASTSINVLVMDFQLVCERCKLYSGNVTVRTCREVRNHDAPDWIVSAYPVDAHYHIRSSGLKQSPISATTPCLTTPLL